MGERSSADILGFGGFRFDRRRGGCLFRLDTAGIAEPVRLGRCALALLGLLLEREGELLSKDEIMKIVWPGRVVEEANLNVQIAHLRHILDEDRERGSYIQTVHGYGYRFVAPVRPEVGSRIPTLTGDSVSVAPVMPEVSTLIAQPTDASIPPQSRILIIVLPFSELGQAPLRYFFADRNIEDLLVNLSPTADVLVISHGSAAAFRNKSIEKEQTPLARKLGPRSNRHVGKL
jgi:DNA-binding winged helix-turn-helix (wHTH) protein